MTHRSSFIIRHTWSPEWRPEGFYVTEEREPRLHQGTTVYGPMPDRATLDAFIAERKRVVGLIHDLQADRLRSRTADLDVSYDWSKDAVRLSRKNRP